MSDVPNDLVDLAETYLESLEGDDADAKEIEDELKYWRAQVDEFEEGTPMYEIAVDERDRLSDRLEEIAESGDARARLRTQLLKRASTEFAPMDEWLDETVISALTHALVGRRKDAIDIGNHSLPGDAADLSKREMVPVAKNAHATCKDALGSENALDAAWNVMTTPERYPISEALAREGSPMNSGAIAEGLDEDATDSPGANLRYVVNSAEYQPYYRKSGAWTLSLVGEYLWETRGPDTGDREDRDGDGGDDGEDGDSQTSLSDVAGDPGGDGDE